MGMGTILHILRNEPNETVMDLIAALSDSGSISVTCLYPDHITAEPVDWNRLVEDIFAHDQVICW